MTSISVHYDLRLPEGTPNPSSGIKNATTHKFPVGSAATNAGDLRGYYDSLRDGLAKAKTQVGEELTEWRDAVGRGEAAKEKKKVVSEDDEDEEEEVDA
jgi:hypothetical protein